MTKLPTIIDFENEWSSRVERFLLRIPCRVELTRLMDKVILFNTETSDEIRYAMDYSTTTYENIYRLELLMVKAGWFPRIAEPTQTVRPLTLAERENLVLGGWTVEDAFSHPGKTEVSLRVWLIRKTRLTNNLFVAYSGDRRLIAVVPDRVSYFLRDLRKGTITPEQGWEWVKEKSEMKIFPFTDSQRWSSLEL